MSPANPQKEQQGHPIASTPSTTFPRQSLLTQPMTVLLLLSLLAIAIYSNTFSASFHFDDIRKIVDNPKIKHLSNFPDLSDSRDVGFLSFALNYHFGQLNVFGYHLINLLIHITNGFLVYLLVRLLFRVSSTPPLTPYALRLTTAPWIALATALLFVAHPIQTQAVTYIVQRFASLAALFYLLTLVFYLKGRLSRPEIRSRHLWYAAALLSTLLAMKTKEITFTLPFMLLLIEAVFFAPLTRKSWIRLIPFFLTLPIIPLSRPGVLGEGEAGIARTTLDISRWDYLLTQFRVILTYLRLLIFPVNQNLDYDYPIAHSLLDPPVFFSFLFLSALFVLAIYLLLSSRFTPSASRLTAFGILWFFLTLSIESSVIPIEDVINEHRLYLPSVGFWLAAGAALLGHSKRWRLWEAIGVGVIVAILSVVTYQRNKIWQDELTLWSDVIRKSSNNAKGYDSLGMAYVHQKKWEEAIREFKTALTLKPDYAEAHTNLGNTYSVLKRYKEAIQEYEMAKKLSPDDALAYYNLGNVFTALGRRDEAIREYQGAITQNPDYAPAHNSLALSYYLQGRLTEAGEELEKTTRLEPDNAGAHNNLGYVYFELGHLKEAVREFQIAIKLKPDLLEAYYNLAQAHQRMGQTQEAIQALEQALRIKPDYDKARQALKSLHQ